MKTRVETAILEEEAAVDIEVEAIDKTTRIPEMVSQPFQPRVMMIAIVSSRYIPLGNKRLVLM